MISKDSMILGPKVENMLLPVYKLQTKYRSMNVASWRQNTIILH